mmetsp:Transcript_14372/g.37240  ORF Transcript_14372/g.37240 Transcript_14372/m.37240 type:complete len:234 (-) Transcript_14372:250-951(-)
MCSGVSRYGPPSRPVHASRTALSALASSRFTIGCTPQLAAQCSADICSMPRSSVTRSGIATSSMNVITMATVPGFLDRMAAMRMPRSVVASMAWSRSAQLYALWLRTLSMTSSSVLSQPCEIAASAVRAHALMGGMSELLGGWRMLDNILSRLTVRFMSSCCVLAARCSCSSSATSEMSVTSRGTRSVTNTCPCACWITSSQARPMLRTGSATVTRAAPSSARIRTSTVCSSE